MVLSMQGNSWREEGILSELHCTPSTSVLTRALILSKIIVLSLSCSVGLFGLGLFICACGFGLVFPARCYPWNSGASSSSVRQANGHTQLSGYSHFYKLGFLRMELCWMARRGKLFLLTDEVKFVWRSNSTVTSVGLCWSPTGLWRSPLAHFK